MQDEDDQIPPSEREALGHLADEPAQTGPFAGVPTPIVELCHSLADFVEAAVGIRPDYTPETLPLVDHYASEARRTLTDRPEVVDLTAQAVGAYFGEVLRRHLVGFWRVPSPNHHDWQVCGEAAYFSINPIGVGYDVVTGSTDHEGPSSAIKLATEDRAAVATKLADLPPVREEEYYTLSARLETLEIVVDTIHASATARGYGDTTYDERDYGINVRPSHYLS